MLIRCFVLLVGISAGANAFAASQVYKWTDKNGKVHYGDPTAMQEAPQPKGSAGAQPAAPKNKSIDEQTWNRAVDRASQTPSGGAGQNISRYAEPERKPYGDTPSTRPSPGSSRTTSSNSYGRGEYRERGNTDVYRQVDRERAGAQQQKLAQEQQAQRRQEIIAQCERNRGSDCRNDQTIRYQENIEKPRGAYR